MKIELVDKIKEQIKSAEDKMKITFAITEPERIEALLEKTKDDIIKSDTSPQIVVKDGILYTKN